MSEAKDTLLRQLTLLRLIPEYPLHLRANTCNLLMPALDEQHST